MTQPQAGEQLVGAYFRVIEECDLVTYNQRSMERSDQMELDVLGVKSTSEGQRIFACEVITHLDGQLYSGSPDTEEWADYGNDSYQYSLERITEKFERIVAYLRGVFDDLELAEIQLWAPYVSEGYQTEGLAEVADRIEAAHGVTVRLVLNDAYTERMTELREAAASSTKDYSEAGFRYLQILEGMR
ncbi:hypothetical protein DM2_602 [Halorubrum sp. DM2]|uniref:hypothetical protein n=1 Tax=unclassified Halorubrum TaxID=2642239 RepID=UPI0003DDB16B|nr:MULTISPECIES: hypothetical protein [unclassified Halorubrum]CDK38639.1 uncharacterized protein BN903_314 [Halorubrum sp. AJ67]VTT85720.1 hypothetical protein DM2_602 [Halorubrum sp. DM2]